MAIGAPERLTAAFNLANFDSGEPALDRWLVERAIKNEISGASRTYVACAGDQIAGYYSLAAGSVTLALAAGKFRRNMPDPIPVIVLGRLAVHRAWQGQGLGRSLLFDAVARAASAAEIAGARAILVQALSDAAADFYRHFGFEGSPFDPRTLMLLLRDAPVILNEQ